VSVTPPADLRLDRVETLAGVDALRAEWEALERATPEATGFQSFVWCRAWLALAGQQVRPRVLCLREGGRLVMLAPLQIERRFGVTIARWIGEPMTQYGDALAAPGEGRARWRARLEAELTRRGEVDLYALTRLRADAVLSGGDREGEALAAPYVEFARRTQRRRRSVERREKRLETLGPVALDAAETPAKRESLARHALALKRAWLDRKGIFSAGLSHRATEDFLAALAREGYLRVNVLRVGGEAAAFDLGFVGGGAYRSLLGCYDARFAAGAPGQTLTRRLIDHCAAEGLEAYDMLLPADEYKRIWSTGETPVYARFQATSLRGQIAAFVLSRLRPLAKRVVKTLAPLHARLKAAAEKAPQAARPTGAGRRAGRTA
jgi:CelD/BcsL family acetyltransferase involved in cellulose biosynthesis